VVRSRDRVVVHSIWRSQPSFARSFCRLVVTRSHARPPRASSCLSLDAPPVTHVGSGWLTPARPHAPFWTTSNPARKEGSGHTKVSRAERPRPVQRCGGDCCTECSAALPASELGPPRRIDSLLSSPLARSTRLAPPEAATDHSVRRPTALSARETVSEPQEWTAWTSRQRCRGRSPRGRQQLLQPHLRTRSRPHLRCFLSHRPFPPRSPRTHSSPHPCTTHTRRSRAARTRR
jgi:hypothetical protein